MTTDAIGALWSGYVVLVHATAYLAGVGLALPFLRRAPADVRAGALAAALVGTLAVSLLCWLPSGWWAWVLPETVSAPLFWLGAAGMATWEAPGSRDLRVVTALHALWLGGAGVVLARLAWAWLAMARVARRATPLDDPAWRALLREASVRMDTGQVAELRASAEVRAPLTWGIVDPVILLPADAGGWPAEQRRLVLLHELAHVRRGDALVQALAQLACAWYWFHPGVRWAHRALRSAREEACDARVLAAGARRSDYAACLLRMSDRVHGAASGPHAAATLAMAPVHGLDRRIRRVLAPALSTSAPRPRFARLALAACALWAFTLGAVRLAPRRGAVWSALASDDWAARAYAARLVAGSRSPAVRAELRARAGHDPHPLVRRLATTPPTAGVR